MDLIWRGVRFICMMGPLRKLVPTFIRRRYALKFGIALVILGLSVGLLGTIGTMQIQEEVKNNVNDNYRDLAEQRAESLETWDQSNRRLLNLIATSDSLQSTDSGEMTEFLSSLSASRALPTGVQETAVVRDNGSVFATSGGRTLTQDTSLSEVGWTFFDRDRAINLRDTEEVYVSEAFEQQIGEETEHWVVYARTIPKQATTLNLTLLYAVDLDEYSEEIASEEGSAGETIMVVDDENRILMSEDPPQVFENYPYQSVTAEPVSQGSVTSIGTTGDAVENAIRNEAKNGSEYASEDYIAASASVDGTNGWVVALHVPQNEAYGFVADIAQYGLLATLGGVVLIGLVGAVLGRNTATSVDRLTTKTAQMEEGNLNVDFETARIDNIGRLYEGFANMRDALSERIQEAREAREEAEAARKDAEEMRDHLQQKAHDYSEVMQTAADGDLTKRLDPESESEAMADIAEEFNEMIGEIEQTTEQLKNFASEVATSSEEVTASSEEVRSASEQVTESIQEISDGAERQNESLQSVQQEMDSLSTTTEEIAASSNEVADIAERTAETGREGRDAAQEAISGMGEIEDESEQAVQEITALEQEMEQIDELIEFISEIAEQTNMLALNANIEASRSGESGEGFSVVAQEVKELAEETKDAADDIEARLETIQDQTHSTAEEVQRTADRVSEHTASVRNAAEALEEIAGYAQETNTGVQEISAATEQQAASTEEVVAMVDEAATISEETTAESENVAAAAEEQTTALTEVSRSASDLAEQASQLSEALDRFDTDADESFDMPMPGEEPSEGLLASEAEEISDESDELEAPIDGAEAAVEEMQEEAPPADDEQFEFEPGFEQDEGSSEPDRDGERGQVDERANKATGEPMDAEGSEQGADSDLDLASETPEAAPTEGSGKATPEPQTEDDDFDMIGFDDVTFEEGDGDDEIVIGEDDDDDESVDTEEPNSQATADDGDEDDEDEGDVFTFNN
jgi:methyl-accepting chemotaxis protein